MDMQGHETGAPLQITFVVENTFWAHDLGVMPIDVGWSAAAD